ncbi:MAG: bifunctional YncE family protein/alkaline phosphatase family protein [Bryobacterales bacterium]|nr:bifunctional YncE family protein/alkaline phosphatase family protein [Bryobacterales bacterium]
MKKLVFAAGLVLIAAAALLSQPEVRERVGALSKGRFLVPTGQVVEPAGRQLPLDTFPMTAAFTPNKRHLLILHGGFHKPSVAVFDPVTMTELSRVSFDDAWLGLAVSPDSHTVYVGGASRHNVHELTLSEEGKLAPSRVFEVTPAAQRKATDFLGDLQLSPDGRLVFATDLYNNAIRVINPQSGRVIETWKTARRPYKILFHPDGKSFFVSSWADGIITQHDTQNGNVLNRVIAGPHSTDMLWREKKTADEEGESNEFKGRIFVTLGNTNTVRVIGVSESKELRAIETINVALYPDSPAGMTPSAVALSPDENSLYVVCSDANAVAAVNIAGGRSRVLGFIPTGWYPTAARALDDKRLLVLNGRGNRSFANPQGPSPVRLPANQHLGNTSPQYVGRLQQGSASIIDTVDPADLIAWTDQVRRNTPYAPEKLYLGHRGDPAVIPAHRTERSPIEHIVYIIKENRTYDQILGDIGKGNSDPSLTVFGQKVTPNHHKLANEFVLLDNFYVNADVSADGHNWSMAAIAPDYVQRMWPNSYAGRRKTYDYEGGEPAATPPAGYLWNSAISKGLRIRNYGYHAAVRPLNEVTDNNHVARVKDESLALYTHTAYRPYDLEYLDVDRAKAFIADLGRMEGEKRFPHFTIIRLGNDHTSGASAGKRTPIAQVADNDAALGMIVESLSRSSFWSKMAIFVLEDDAQNGPDHVDSHRSPAFVISPYVKRGAIDSTFYNTTSMLRTMELILGLNPLTMHDAGARPMLGAFTPFPDNKAYTAEKPNVSLEDRNPANTALARRSARFNFTEADEIDDDEMNEIIWLAVRGTPAPTPVRSLFGK